MKQNFSQTTMFFYKELYLYMQLDATAIQLEPENSGTLRRLLNSSYSIKFIQ